MDIRKIIENIPKIIIGIVIITGIVTIAKVPIKEYEESYEMQLMDGISTINAGLILGIYLKLEDIQNRE